MTIFKKKKQVIKRKLNNITTKTQQHQKKTHQYFRNHNNIKRKQWHLKKHNNIKTQQHSHKHNHSVLLVSVHVTSIRLIQLSMFFDNLLHKHVLHICSTLLSGVTYSNFKEVHTLNYHFTFIHSFSYYLNARPGGGDSRKTRGGTA